MAQTPRLSIQYPDENQDPFWNSFVSFVETIDSHLFANMSDRNMILKGGGTFTFNNLSGDVTWSDTIVLWDLLSGLSITIATSNVTLGNGEIGYVDVGRKLNQNTAATMTVGTSVGLGEGKIAVFVRLADRLFFRNGAVLVAGTDAALLENGGAIGEAKVGVATFAGASDEIDVTFDQAYSDANYYVVGLVPDFALTDTLYAPVADITASGFKIKTAGGATPTASDRVFWRTERV